MDEFMCDAYELLIVAGWIDVADDDDDASDLRSVEMTHPLHCPHDPVDIHLAYAIMFAAAGAVARDRQPLS